MGGVVFLLNRGADAAAHILIVASAQPRTRTRPGREFPRRDAAKALLRRDPPEPKFGEFADPTGV